MHDTRDEEQAILRLIAKTSVAEHFANQNLVTFGKLEMSTSIDSRRSFLEATAIAVATATVTSFPSVALAHENDLKAVVEIVDANDSRAVRNKNNILALYDLMINKKRPAEAVAKFVSPAYRQHNPLLEDGPGGLERSFAKVTAERSTARVVVYRIIASGDHVWAHVNFLNLYSDNPGDTGVAGVDIYRMDADGKAIEHWDVLQTVGDPKNSAPWVAPNIPRANSNGMF